VQDAASVHVLDALHTWQNIANRSRTDSRFWSQYSVIEMPATSSIANQGRPSVWRRHRACARRCRGRASPAPAARPRNGAALLWCPCRGLMTLIATGGGSAPAARRGRPAHAAFAQQVEDAVGADLLRLPVGPGARSAVRLFGGDLWFMPRVLRRHR